MRALATRSDGAGLCYRSAGGSARMLVKHASSVPALCAALLIFSQIFKKPLQEMGQAYYAIDGSWDDPTIDVANQARFASSSSLAGCIVSSE